MLLSNIFCALSLAGLACAQNYPLPVPCTGPACINPKGRLDYQGFSVVRRQSDGKYFRFAKSNETGQGLSVATALALAGPWNFAYTALDGALKSPLAIGRRLDANVWAPRVHYLINRYHLFYGINTAPFNFDQCVATPPNLEPGSWTEHGAIKVTNSATGKTQASESYVNLDGILLAQYDNPSGASTNQPHYMILGSYQWGLWGFNVSSDFLTIASGATVDEIMIDQYNTGVYAGNKTAGPYQLAAGNYVYLFYSIGNCCAANDSVYDNSVYRVQVCRRPRKGPMTSPFVDRDGYSCLTGGQGRRGTTILASRADGQVFAPGSVGTIYAPEVGTVVMYYQ